MYKLIKLNKSILLGLLLVAFLLPVSKVKAQVVKVEMTIDGLECAACSFGIQKALNRLGFVESMTPDIHKHTAVLMLKNMEKFDLEALAGAIHDAGFYITRLLLFTKPGFALKENTCLAYPSWSLTTMPSPQKATHPNAIQVLGLSFMPKPSYKKLGIKVPPAPCNGGEQKLGPNPILYWGYLVDAE